MKLLKDPPTRNDPLNLPPSISWTELAQAILWFFSEFPGEQPDDDDSAPVTQEEAELMAFILLRYIGTIQKQTTVPN